MSATSSVIINTQPATYSMVSAPLWYEFSSTGYTFDNFKYVVDVYTFDPATENIESELGRYKFPPRPINGNGLFTPNKILKSDISYDFTPFITNTVYASHSIVEYAFIYGQEYNPNYSILASTGVYWLPNQAFIIGNPLTASNQLKIGDTINISMTNPVLFGHLNGEQEIIAITPSIFGPIYYIDVLVVTQSGVPDSTGIINNLQRFEDEFSNRRYALNGTRQYDQINLNFGDAYLQREGQLTPYLSNFEATGHSFTGNGIYKPNYLSNFETTSYLIDQGRPVYSIDFTDTNEWIIYDENDDPCGGKFVVQNDVGLYGIPDASCPTLHHITYSTATFSAGTSYVVQFNIPSVTNSGDPQYMSISLGGNETERFFGVGTFSSTVLCGPSGILQVNGFIDGIGGAQISSITIYEEISTVNQMFVRTFDSINTLINTYTYSISLLPGYKRIDVPSGPANLTGMGVSLTNIDNYEVVIGTTFSFTNPFPPHQTLVFPYPYSYKSFKVIDNCSPYPNIRLAFQNRLGGIDYWNFNWKSQKTQNTERTSYRQVLDWNYQIGDRQDTILGEKVTEEYTVTSDWLTEYEYAFLAELSSSPNVYVVDEDNALLFPVVITNTQYTFKTKIKDKLFSLEVSYKHAYDVNIQSQ